MENLTRKNIFFSHTFSHAPFSSLESEDLAVHLYPGAVTIQGVLRRKTLLKEGKKPTVRFIYLFIYLKKKKALIFSVSSFAQL